MKWIRNRMPSEDGEYIVTICGATEATTLYYDRARQGFKDYDGNYYNVVAWQPIPTAYKEELTCTLAKSVD